MPWMTVDGNSYYLCPKCRKVFDEEAATLLVEIEYFDDGFGSFALEYDSSNPKASVREGAFKRLGSSVPCRNTEKWTTISLKITGARFANRANGGDFRLERLWRGCNL